MQRRMNPELRVGSIGGVPGGQDQSPERLVYRPCRGNPGRAPACENLLAPLGRMIQKGRRTPRNHETGGSAPEHRERRRQVFCHSLWRLQQAIVYQVDNARTRSITLEQVRQNGLSKGGQRGTLSRVQGTTGCRPICHWRKEIRRRRWAVDLEGGQNSRLAALTIVVFGGTLTPLMRDAQPHKEKMDGRSVRSLNDPETLRLLIRSIGEGIYITDSRGRFLDANPALLEIFGMKSLEELQRYEVPQLLADPGRRKEELAILANEGSVREFELEIVRPDGLRRTVLDTTYQVRDPETGEVAFHGVLFDITRRKELEDRLREQLTRDALTGCYNRRFLFDLESDYQAGGETRWGCIFIDIDHFKGYNDRHGHASGDQVLQRMARFLMREVRSDEPVIRLGGDEFLIVLGGENSTRTPAIAERLRQAAARSAPVAFSLGWAIREAEETFEQTIERADHVLINVRVLFRSGDYASLPSNLERRKS